MTGALTTCVVIDTNVLKVAEGDHPGASDTCRSACLELVRRVADGLVVAVDDGDEITLEYLRAFRGTGKAGVGAKLAKKLHGQRHNTDVCSRVGLTSIDEPPGSYEEVPRSLRDFDVDDQKFLAVAATEPASPQIHTAVDGEWWARRQDLATCGLDIQFACLGDFLDRDRNPR